MVHTLPPWTTKYRMVTVFGNIDDAELAARLGSIVTFDRRGQVVWFDDFESPILNWEPYDSNGDAALVLTTERKLMGSQCLKITSGSGALDEVGIDKKLAYPVKGKIGFEIAATVVDNTGSPIIEMYLYDGTNVYISKILYNVVADKIQVWEPNGGYTDVQTGFNVKADSWMFNIFKVVVDFTNEKYVRAILNDQTLDLSSYTIQKDTDDTEPHLWIRYWYYSRAATGITNYIDNVIVTQNEP